MEIADANIVLRYLLNDNKIHSKKSGRILEHNDVHLPFEVCAEVVYVLEKVYAVSREYIRDALTILPFIIHKMAQVQGNSEVIFVILFKIDGYDNNCN